MHVVILGATGGTGLHLVQQALDRGHTVTAVSRRPAAFPSEHPRLGVVREEVTDPAGLVRAVQGADAVVSVLGTRFSRNPITLYSESARALVEALRTAGVERLVVTSASAVDPVPDPSWSHLERFLVTRVLTRIGATLYADMRAMEDVVDSSGLAWTVMRPHGLVDLEPPTEYAVAVDHLGGQQTARRDLASAILDELDPARAHVRQRVAVATTNKRASVASIIWSEGIRPTLRR